MRSAPAIGFEHRLSRTLSVCIVLLTALAVTAIALSGLPPWMSEIMATAALAYGGLALWRYRHPRVTALTWRSDGSVSIRLAGRAGESVEVQGVLQDARVLGFLIVLHLRWPGGRAGLWILPDNLDADARRRLRVRLGSEGAGASVNTDAS
ncbi:MAG TPA: protein YgfX [Rhodanobacteraceae bacterium]|nr:protein YgfX [Rhodanobacteraceae bacterium]